MMLVHMKFDTSYFKDKKITVMGLGLLGRGVGDTEFLAQCGADLIVTDLKTEKELQSSLSQLSEFENITWRLGGHEEEDFKNRDYILVGAGVPLDSKYLETARQANIPLKQSAAWFAELSKVPIIGVTGTRGKSTVTAMIHHVLMAITGEEILLGGNVRGASNLQLLNQVHEDSLCVMELDSWQLQGWGWSEMSPQVAVFTNFMEDHLNYYQKGEMTKAEGMTAYFKDKAQIFLHQEESGTLVTTPEVLDWIKQEMPEITLGQELVLTDSSIIEEEAHLSMPGEHNRLNAALAKEALKATGLKEEEIDEAFSSFQGVAGRLELLRTRNNVRIYNDNNATTPQATTAALEALDVGNQNVVLIAGGQDKGIDPAPLALAIKQHCKKVILTPGTGTDALLELVHNNDVDVTVVENLAVAVEEACLSAQPSDIILFSPAYSSFAQYANEYERNDEFVALVNSL